MSSPLRNAFRQKLSFRTLAGFMFIAVVSTATALAQADWVQLAKLVASDGAPEDYFGVSVSISRDYVIVGAQQSWGASQPLDDGKAYIFKWDGAGWSQQQKLLASDGAAGDWFGQSVSISDDLAIVGAHGDDDNGDDSGSAYIFKRDGTSWVQQQKLLASDGAADDAFGQFVSISGDFAIVGAPDDDDNGNNFGSAYIFRWDGTSWIQQQKLLASDGAAGDFFGVSVSISGDLAIMGAPGDKDKGKWTGSAYIFKRDGTSWVQQQKLLASDGAAGDFFGHSVSISSDLTIVGAGEGGSAYIFKWDGTSWIQQQELLASDGAAGDGFGASVSISGDLAIVGAHYDNDKGSSSGSAYIFKWDGMSWVQQQKLLASDGAAGDRFGVSVSINGDLAVVGAYWDDDAFPEDVACDSGSAYLLNLPGLISRACAYGPRPFDGALHTDTWVNLEWRAGDLAVSHDVYLGDDFDDVNDGLGDTFRGNQTSTFLGTGFPGSPYPEGLVRGTTYYWRVDEVNDAEPNSPWKGPIWSFTIEPKRAYNPSPADGVESVALNVELSWTAGLDAALHTIYFGDNLDDVNNAIVGLKQVTTTYTPGPLEFGKTYYWRVDELTGGRGAEMHKGDIWSFTTIDFLVVDDFEDYDIGNNEIWWSWKDGLGYAAHNDEPAYYGNGTGSVVGNENTNSYCEETIIHGGKQSMPVFYDNNQQDKLKYSEVEMALIDLRNWTVEGVGVLTLWFHGAESNSAEPMYVVINGNAVVTHSNPNAVQIETWTQWEIDLQKFVDQGVDMTDVHTIGLGFGDRNSPQFGGSGKMYFDDIRLRK